MTNFTTLEEQVKLLGEFVEGQLGEPCTVSLHSDGSVSVETEVTPERNGRGFGFDTLEDLIDKIGDYKRD